MPTPEPGRAGPFAPRERRVLRESTLAPAFTTAPFDRVVTAHFYGHLPHERRAVFLAEARRVAPEPVVIHSALRPVGEAGLGRKDPHLVLCGEAPSAGLAGSRGAPSLTASSWASASSSLA